MQSTPRQRSVRWLTQTALAAMLALSAQAPASASNDALPPALQSVQELYLAFYQRPGDPAGMLYWADVASRDFRAVLTEFSGAREAGRLYGPINAQTIGSVIDKIYLALFGAAPDAAGRQYYIDNFNNGRFTATDLAYSILKGAQDGVRPDLTAVRNKLIAANRFVRALDPEMDGRNLQATYNADDEITVRAWMVQVTASRLYTSAQVRDFIVNQVAAPGDPIRVGTPTPPQDMAPKLPHTGVTDQQCLQVGTDARVPCNSAQAIALSGAGNQDGMRAHINPMSYSEVPGYDRTECVKDNVTGLIWEGKVNIPGHLRHFELRYTNQGDGSAGDVSEYIQHVVNAKGLCGFHDWRLPTAEELHGLVDYSKSRWKVHINREWFPHTQRERYWTSDAQSRDPSNTAWYINFNDGDVNDDSRSFSYAVRLVRSGR
ncbi:Lcl C-terminal domain-containing protein [Allofranklinella schreckenbergeri]|nr:DUF1566 domain-containing protein [Allofranklinella schreckenbergeri]